MTTRNYERTWCDYLTKCPHNENIEIGSYECSICKNHIGFKENKAPKFEIGDYSRYSYIYTGQVECKL